MMPAWNTATHSPAQKQAQHALGKENAFNSALTSVRKREKNSVWTGKAIQTQLESAEILMMTHALNGEKQKNAQSPCQHAVKKTSALHYPRKLKEKRICSAHFLNYSKAFSEFLE